MKNKKSQASLIAAVLLIIIMVIVVVMIVIVLVNPGLLNLKPTAEAIKEDKKAETQTQTPELVCYSPYIKVGNTCCLDKNFNRICDSDEAYDIKKEEPKSECDYPYISRGSGCCLDDNRNRICDSDEYRRDRDRNRYTTSLDSPFDLRDIDVSNRELNLEIKNEDDEEITIKTIDVEDCDRIHPDETIQPDEREFFDFECDFPSRINSDIEIEYTVGDSTDVKTADGKIREDTDYYDYYYDYNY